MQCLRHIYFSYKSAFLIFESNALLKPYHSEPSCGLPPSKISDIVSAGAICLDLRTYYSGGYHDLPEENVIDIFNPDGTLKYDKVSIKYYPN